MAAKIGQELLERNQRLEERVSVLEFQLTSSTDLITQLRHDLTVKTDLLHVYTNDAIEDSSPVEVSAFKKWYYIKVSKFQEGILVSSNLSKTNISALKSLIYTLQCIVLIRGVFNIIKCLYFWPRFYIVVLGIVFFFFSSSFTFFQFLFRLFYPFSILTFIFLLYLDFFPLFHLDIFSPFPFGLFSLLYLDFFSLFCFNSFQFPFNSFSIQSRSHFGFLPNCFDLTKF